MNAPVYRGLLLTEFFLVDGILESPPWKALDDSAFRRFVDALPALVGERAENAKINEANTEAEIILPLLNLLGWENAHARQIHMQSDIPDILLMSAPPSSGNWSDDEENARMSAVSFLEAKKWGLPLDRREGKSEAPSTQMLRYLTNAASLPGGKIRWGILTNGWRWRLYWQNARSRSEEFFELDLRRIARSDCETPEHWSKVFFLMFSRSAFLPAPAPDGPTFHQYAVGEGRLWEAKITEELSAELLDESLPDFARAVAEKMPGDRTDPDFFERLRETVTIILFRLLFVLYAEDRGLLPVGNSAYRRSSLSGMRDDIAERVDKGIQFSEGMDQYSSQFSKLCLAIGQGDKNLGLPPYNGNLFSENGMAVGGVLIPDSVFAGLVDKLSRRTTRGKKRRINYRDLSVRHLGAIYERLLLHEFIDHPQGGVQARLSPHVRKAGGSYYTPDELTELVIRRTLDPLLAEKKRAWDKAIKKDAPESETEKLDPAAAALNLKVCDPAMGSGHFLAALVDYIADKALEYMAEANQKERPSPLAKEIEKTRKPIVRNAKAGGFELKEHLDDRLLVRRLALKRVVYGVDKNPWAAELAKLSLWLHTFTVGAPLSFLDHHLRTGDSLFGEWIESGLSQMEKFGGALFSREFMKSARDAAALMAAVEARPDADVGEARRSARDFKKFTEANRKLENLLRLTHSLRWMAAEESNLPRKEREKHALNRNGALVHLFAEKWGDPAKVLENWALPKNERGPVADLMRKMLTHAAELDRRERFLHWESAFPGVWPLKNGEQQEGGFDAIVGNPPWERMKMQEVEWFNARKPKIGGLKPSSARAREIDRLRKLGDPLIRDFDSASRIAEATMKVARKCGEYPMLSRGDINLCSLFVERAVDGLVRPNGIVGLLSPSGVYGDKTSSAFFRKMAEERRIAAIFDFENRARLFREVHPQLKFCAFVAGGEKRKFGRMESAFFLRSAKDVEDSSRLIAVDAADFTLMNPNTGNITVFRSQREAALTIGIYRRWPVLRSGDSDGIWPVRYHTMFHLAGDSRHFQEAGRLREDDYYAVDGAAYRHGENFALPLYVGRMIYHFNHRNASVVKRADDAMNPYFSELTTPEELRDRTFSVSPQFWVDESLVTFPEGLEWAVALRDITNATNERGLVAAVVPRAAYGHTLPLLFPILPTRPESNGKALQRWEKERDAALADYRANAPLYVANLCSFALDYVCRQKMQGMHASLYILEQLPVLPVSAYTRKFGEKTAAQIVRDHVLRLTYTADDIRPFAADMGCNRKPFVWDDEERAHLRARLDALYFILYGIGADDANFILDTFPIVHQRDRDARGRELTRELILSYMKALNAGDAESRIKLQKAR